MNAPVTRRALLGATAVLGVVALPAVALDPSTDRALIAAADVLKALRARELAAWVALPDDHPDDFPAYVACCDLSGDICAAGEALAEVAAVTPAGLAAKASAMLALVGRGSDADTEAFTEHHVLVASVLRDAARLGPAEAPHA